MRGKEISVQFSLSFSIIFKVNDIKVLICKQFSTERKIVKHVILFVVLQNNFLMKELMLHAFLP